jgi:hypothetical protein
MPLDIVLNELSYRVPAADVWVARDGMFLLIDTIRAAQKLGTSRTLRFHHDLYRSAIAADYTVADWLNDAAIDRDARLFFKTVATTSPFLSDLAGSSVDERFRGAEFRYGQESVLGLGVAYLLDALAISLPFSHVWDVPELSIVISELDDEGQIVDDSGLVKHAANLDHVRKHERWIDERRRREVLNGRELWTERSSLFPRLVFCSSVKTQLEQLGNGDALFRQVMRKLFELEVYCRTWDSGPFDPALFPGRATPDSESTLRAFPEPRTIRCPDGISRIFTWHVRATPGKWRIYFHPVEVERTMLIGYIGPKLPTVSHPT